MTANARSCNTFQYAGPPQARQTNPSAKRFPYAFNGGNADPLAAGCVYSERTVNGITSHESRYYLLGGKMPAKAFASAVRNHWVIENKLHWVLDMTFREGECRVRRGNSAENLAILRHMALNLLKQDTTVKLGIKSKRKAAGWDNDYLPHLLNGNLDA